MRHYAPGMRVEIRDAEWRIKRVDDSSDGGHVLACEGLSELVQGREALFLTRLEQARILDPCDTVLVDDTSSNFGASLLYIDSMLRKADLTADITYATHDATAPATLVGRISEAHPTFTARDDTQNTALGWEDIQRLQSGTVTGTATETFTDDTQPDGPTERTVNYTAPFFNSDREQDYRTAWAFFSTRN